MQGRQIGQSHGENRLSYIIMNNKNYLYRRVKIKVTPKIFWSSTTSNTPLDIQDSFLECDRYEFIFENERNLLDRKGK